MNCDQYKHLIQEFHDGELKRESESFLFVHLSSCEECREFLKLLNLTSVTIEQEKTYYPVSLDERILRRAASENHKTNIFSKRLPAYITYAVTLLLITVSVFAFSSSSQQKNEMRQVINALNEQNAVVKEQSRQLLMLMNGLPELKVTSQLENEIIINAKL